MKVAIYLLEFLSRTVIYTYSHAGSHDNLICSIILCSSLTAEICNSYVKSNQSLYSTINF
jgi:hypothetical protein